MGGTLITIPVKCVRVSIMLVAILVESQHNRAQAFDQNAMWYWVDWWNVESYSSFQSVQSGIYALGKAHNLLCDPPRVSYSYHAC